MWTKVSFADRDFLLSKHQSGTLTNHDAVAVGMNLETLKRELRRHQEKMRETPKYRSIKPASPLTKHYATPTDDQHTLEQYLVACRDAGEYVTVMHLCDIHFPFHSTRALDLAYQLVEYIQPTIIVVGSDAVDFAQISTFDADPNLPLDDVLDQFEQYWSQFVHHLRTLSPCSLLVYILGNHEQRIFDFISREAPSLRETVLRRFREICTQYGAVLWIGEVESVRIGPLLVMHGNRGGSNPAKALLEEVGAQVSVMAGHVHRLSYFGKEGIDFSTEAITSGCLTENQHYEARRDKVRWQQGTALAEVNLASREVYFTNLKFEVEPERMWVRFERRTFESRF